MILPSTGRFCRCLRPRPLPWECPPLGVEATPSSLMLTISQSLPLHCRLSLILKDIRRSLGLVRRRAGLPLPWPLPFILLLLILPTFPSSSEPGFRMQLPPRLRPPRFSRRSTPPPPLPRLALPCSVTGLRLSAEGAEPGRLGAAQPGLGARAAGTKAQPIAGAAVTSSLSATVRPAGRAGPEWAISMATAAGAAARFAGGTPASPGTADDDRAK